MRFFLAALLCITASSSLAAPLCSDILRLPKESTNIFIKAKVNEFNHSRPGNCKVNCIVAEAREALSKELGDSDLDINYKADRSFEILDLVNNAMIYIKVKVVWLPSTRGASGQSYEISAARAGDGAVKSVFIEEVRVGSFSETLLDPLKGRKIGSILMLTVARIAESNGVHHISGRMDQTNRAFFEEAIASGKDTEAAANALPSRKILVRMGFVFNPKYSHIIKGRQFITHSLKN